MKKLVVVFITTVMLFSCGKKEKEGEEYNPSASTEETATTDPSSYDPKRGEGKFTTVEQIGRASCRERV